MVRLLPIVMITCNLRRDHSKVHGILIRQFISSTFIGLSILHEPVCAMVDRLLVLPSTFLSHR
jgi:hypothetical protein